MKINLRKYNYVNMHEMSVISSPLSAHTAGDITATNFPLVSDLMWCDVMTPVRALPWMNGSFSSDSDSAADDAADHPSQYLLIQMQCLFIALLPLFIFIVCLFVCLLLARIAEEALRWRTLEQIPKVPSNRVNVHLTDVYFHVISINLLWKCEMRKDG